MRVPMTFYFLFLMFFISFFFCRRSVKQHRKLLFDEKQRSHALVLRKQLQDWSLKNTNIKSATTEQIKIKEDLEAR